MNFGIRWRSIKKMIAACSSPPLFIAHSLGLKPARARLTRRSELAAHNRIYYRTTPSIWDAIKALFGYPSKTLAVDR